MYPPPRWFEGARLNFAENMLRHRGSTPAVYEATEPEGDGGVLHLASYTHDELRQAVANAARAMRRRGLKTGDRVALYAPNCAATLIAFLAAASIGAVWLSCAPDFGAAGVLERLRALQPRFLFTCDGVRYNGRKHPHAAKVKEVLDGLKVEGQPLELLVEIEYIGGQTPIEGAMRWADFLEEGAGDDHIEYSQLDFNHPLWVLFSSGTTGELGMRMRCFDRC
jgi:acetoacetyl-CoA synthetase